jgi:MYXO-CTERM domain-containing protein
MAMVATVLLVLGPVQETDTGTDTTTTTESNDGDMGLWGLLGLTGLIGLAGLARRDRREDTRYDETGRDTQLRRTAQDSSDVGRLTRGRVGLSAFR